MAASADLNINNSKNYTSISPKDSKNKETEQIKKQKLIKNKLTIS